MKLIAPLIFLLSAVAYGGPVINIQTDACSAVNSENDTHFTAEISNCKGFVTKGPSGLNGSFYKEKRYPYKALNFERNITLFGTDAPGVPCTLIDADGKIYKTRDWYNEIRTTRKHKWQYNEDGKLVRKKGQAAVSSFRVECYGAQEQ